MKTLTVTTPAIYAVMTPDGLGLKCRDYPRIGFDRVGVKLIKTGEILYYFTNELTK